MQQLKTEALLKTTSVETAFNSQHGTSTNNATVETRRFGQITSDSLRMQITGCELRIRLHLLYGNWPAIKVDAEFAAVLDAELRQRHNESRGQA
jgi:hypothetical protein